MAGAVLMLGYLLGFVPGAVMSVVGGLGLITFGRCITADAGGAARAATALTILAGALGVAALRWGTISLQQIVGAQSVLGPSITVGPNVAAGAAWGALVAGVAAVGVWAAAPPSGSPLARRPGHILEVAVVVLALSLVFAAPGAGGSLGSVGSAPLEWAITLGVTVLGTAAALLVARHAGGRAGWVVLGLTAVVVLAAGGVVTTI